MGEKRVASEKKFGIKVEENVMVTTRDGVRVAVDVYRPDAPGKFPALLALSPYGKSAQVFETPPQPFGKSIFEASVESGDPNFYVSRGICLLHRGICVERAIPRESIRAFSPTTKAKTGRYCGVAG